MDSLLFAGQVLKRVSGKPFSRAWAKLWFKLCYPSKSRCVMPDQCMPLPFTLTPSNCLEWLTVATKNYRSKTRILLPSRPSTWCTWGFMYALANKITAVVWMYMDFLYIYFFPSQFGYDFMVDENFDTKLIEINRFVIYSAAGWRHNFSVPTFSVRPQWLRTWCQIWRKILWRCVLPLTWTEYFLVFNIMWNLFAPTWIVCHWQNLRAVRSRKSVGCSDACRAQQTRGQRDG